MACSILDLNRDINPAREGPSVLGFLNLSSLTTNDDCYCGWVARAFTASGPGISNPSIMQRRR